MTTPEHDTARRTTWPKVVETCGVGLAILGGAMFFVAAMTFTATGPLHPVIDFLGAASFWGFLPTVFTAGVLLMIANLGRRIADRKSAVQ
jgi:hypothetical protein